MSFLEELGFGLDSLGADKPNWVSSLFPLGLPLIPFCHLLTENK